jgi:hypothetical protein
MAKRLTKTEMRRLYAAILSKTKKLWDASNKLFDGMDRMSSKDMMTIEAIISKYQKKL